MKRKLPLLLVMLMLLSLMCAPVAYAAPGGLPSAGRVDDEIDIDDDDVPLVELPTAKVEAEATVTEDGTADVKVSEEQIRNAIESVTKGDAARISIAAKSTAESGTSAVKTAVPKQALAAVVEQTDAELEIVTDAGELTLPKAALSAILEKAGGEDVTFKMERKAPEAAKEQLQAALGATMSGITEESLQGGSVTEINVLSGDKSIDWGGGEVALELPIGSGQYEAGKGYRIIQINADGTVTEYTGRCVMGSDGQLHLEISVTQPGTFVVLAGAVEEDMGGTSPVPMVASPLAAAGNVGSSSGGSSMPMWFAVAGLVLVAGAAGGVMLKRRQDS